VFIGEDTARLVSDQFELQEMGELQLKGKQQRVRAYKVLGRRSKPGGQATIAYTGP